MKILFNRSTLKHNSSDEIEGSYRINSFSNYIETLPDISGEELIGLVHTEKHIRKVKRATELKSRVAEIKTSPSTYEAAIISVALAVEAARSNDFAITRPPGHHATRDESMGFCFFNNAAIAAQYLLNQGKRVCIIDIDGHYGNGTASIFRKNENVLYCSLHQDSSYPGGVSGNSLNYCYPKTGKASIENILNSNGSGSLNVPLPAKSGDDILSSTMDIMSGRISQFNPDAIAVSAGFDGYHEDKILNLRFTEKGFNETGLKVRKLCKDVFAVLEGGYHGKIGYCVQSFVDGINGVSYDSLEPTASSNDVISQFERLKMRL